MIIKKDTNKARVARHKRVRKKIAGTADCPRLCVYRSNANITAQVIDDEKSVTLVTATTLEKDFQSYGGNKESAREIGKLIAKRAIEKGIENVKFDRGGYLYHGRVQELAEGAREGGLKF